MRTMGPVFPVFLRLVGRDVLVVGAGGIGTRKIDELCEAGAKVTVVSVEASEDVHRWARAGRLTLDLRPFEQSDVADKWLVVSATNEPNVNAEVSAACTAHRIFVCAVDDPPNASVFFGAVVRRDPFLIAISSEGQLPGLTRLVREVVERSLPSPHWIAAARELRREWKRDKTPMGDRFQELVRLIARENAPSEISIAEVLDADVGP